MSAQPQIAALPPSDRFAAIMDALCRAMANEANKSRLAGPLVVLIWTRLRRLADRFSTLLARTATAPRPGRRNRREHRTRERDRTSKNLPRGFAWLRGLLPGIAANAAQLDHLLSDPEMTALLAANPAAGRVIRPLCHTLGIRVPDFLSLPPRKRRPTAQKPRKPARPRIARRTPAPPNPADQNPAHRPLPRSALRHGHIAMPAPYIVPLRL